MKSLADFKPVHLVEIEQTYIKRFPLHAFATDSLKHGIRMYPAELAIKKSIVQHNYKHSLAWIVYDVDRNTAAFDWEDLDAPPPNIIVINQENGYGHLFYGLESPVHRNSKSSEKALRYLASIDIALTEKLGADPGYSKLLSKNPLNEKWFTVYLKNELYDLEEIADWLDLDKYQDRRRRLPTIGFGRNCTLFELLRLWAYRARRQQPFLSEQFFYEAVYNHALSINGEFTPPLPHSEVRSTARSVSQWTWRRMSLEGFKAHQSRLGKLSGEVRLKKSMELRQRIKTAVEECPMIGQSDIAAMLGVTRETVNRHLKAIKHSVT